MQVTGLVNVTGRRFRVQDRPSVNRQVIGSSPIAGASLMASDLRECMNSDVFPRA